MRAVAVALFLLGLLCQTLRADMMLTGVGGGPVVAAAGNSLSLDGSNHNAGSGATVVVSLTTTTGSGVIVVAANTNAASVSNVTAAGLSFVQRTSITGISGTTITNWTAPYSSNFSGNITVTPASSAFTAVTAFGIGGAPSTSYFDPNGSLPVESTGTILSITTSNANDFIFANYATSNASSTAGSGFAAISAAANFQLVEYVIVSTTQSGLSAGMGGSTPNGGILDAIL